MMSRVSRSVLRVSFCVVIACACVTLTCSAAYTELYSIGVSSSGKQWINTGYLPKMTDRIEMKFKLIKSGASMTLWCARKTNVSKSFTSFIILNGSTYRVRADHGSCNSWNVYSDGGLGDESPYVLVADGKSLDLSLNGVKQKLPLNSTTDTEAGCALTLFASSEDGTGGTPKVTGAYADLIFYYLKVYDEDGNLIHHFVPARDNEAAAGSTEKYGVMDIVGETPKFCPNKGTTALRPASYFVDAEKGDDRYNGESPTVDGGDVGPKKTMAAANELMVSGDTLLIAPGRYDLTAVISNAKAKLAYRGTGAAPGDVVVNGGGTSRGFSLSGSSVTLSNFTISNCYTSAAYNGAGARLASGGTLTNMVFVACTNDCSNGGAVYASSWTTFVDCKFVENYTIKDGGAVYMDDANGTSHSFLRCTFLRNGAAVNGGVYGSAGQYAGRTMRDCRFEGNIAKGAGGCFTGPFTVVSNCQFIANWAKGSGGVYTGGNYSYVEGAASTTNPNRYLHQNCLFSNNVANSGGCFNIARTVGYSFRDCVFADNLATNGSGGCFLLNGGGTCGDFLRCSFYRNMATNSAGGSAGVFYGFAKSFGGCHFEGNRANVSGGCIYWGGTDENVRKITCRQNSGPWWMAVTNSTFVNNGLTGRSTKHKWQCGGGVTACGIQSTATYGYNINAYQPLYADCTFTSNFVWATTNVYQGVIAQGGVLMEPGGATLRRCTFAYNRVIGNGGAFCGMCTNGMTDCTFVGNAADYEDASAYAYPAAGGAVLLTGGPGTWTNVIERCVFSNNWVNGRGASALAQARSTMILRDSTFVGNSCVSNGFVSSSNAGRTAGGAVGIARRYESVDGGGRYGGAYTPKFLIERCSFVSNDTFSAGGAIASYRLYDSNTAVPCGTIRNCLFEGNRAYDTTYTGSSWSDILGRGAALAFNQTTTTVENCTFVGNVSQKRVNKADSYRQGGAVFVNTPNTTLTNCVFYGNADGTAATTYDDIYISDATKLGHCFAKTGGILVDKENDNIVSDANPFRADDHTAYAVRKDCGSGAGLKLGWMTADSLDCGGKPRLAKNEDGEVVVDFGCYQFWRKPGLLLFVW